MAFIELTSGTGEPILIDPDIITVVEPWEPVLVIPDGPASRLHACVRFGDEGGYVVVAETSAQVRDLIRKVTDPLAPVDADHAETPSEYAEDEPADDTPARPGSQHDEDHATDISRDHTNGL